MSGECDGFTSLERKFFVNRFFLYPVLFADAVVIGLAMTLLLPLHGEVRPAFSPMLSKIPSAPIVPAPEKSPPSAADAPVVPADVPALPADAPAVNAPEASGAPRIRPLDDFIDVSVNRDGAAQDRIFSLNGANVSLEVFASADRANGILRIAYDVTPAASSAGYRQTIAEDLENYRTFSFMTKGETGGEDFWIGFSAGRVRRRVPLGRYMPSGCPAEWQRVNIPLEDLGAKAGPGSCEVSIVVEHDDIRPTAGAVYIKDVRLER